MKIAILITKIDDHLIDNSNYIKLQNDCKQLCPKTFEVHERIDAKGKIIVDLAESEINETLRQVFIEKPDAILIALYNSSCNPVHEKIFKNLLTTAGYKSVYVSHQTVKFNSFLSTMFAKPENSL